MVNTLQRTHGRNVLANYVADGPGSPVTTRTSITVRVVINPRCIAKDSEVGSNAKRGVVLGVVDASIVVRLKQMGKGGVMGVRLDGRGLMREKAEVVVRRLKLSRSRTRGLLLLRNSMGGTVSTCQCSRSRWGLCLLLFGRRFVVHVVCRSCWCKV